MLEFFTLTLKYKQDDNKDTIKYSRDVDNLVKDLNQRKIIFSTERKNINKTMIKNIIKSINTTEYEEESIEISIGFYNNNWQQINDVVYMSTNADFNDKFNLLYEFDGKLLSKME